MARLTAAADAIRLDPDDEKDDPGDKKKPPADEKKPDPVVRGPGGGLPKPQTMNCEDLPESILKTLPGKICPPAEPENTKSPQHFDWKGGPRSEFANSAGTVRRIHHQGGMVELTKDSSTQLTMRFYANGTFDVTSLEFPPNPSAVATATIVYSQPPDPGLGVDDTILLNGDHNLDEGDDSFDASEGVRISYYHDGVTGAVAVTDRYSAYRSSGSNTKELHWAVVHYAPNGAKRIIHGVSWSSWDTVTNTLASDTLKQRTDVTSEIEFFAGGASTVTRRELKRYKFITGIGDRLIEHTVYPQTGESLTTTSLWYESGDFTGERKLVSNPDGSWSADVYNRPGGFVMGLHPHYLPPVGGRDCRSC